MYSLTNNKKQKSSIEFCLCLVTFVDSISK
jgi:hypothetical protein